MTAVSPAENGESGRPRRAGIERRLQFTQSPGAAVFADKLARQTGLPKSELYNTAMRLLEVVLPALVDDRDPVRRLILQDVEPGVRAVLGDILATIPRGERFGGLR
ncbi:hypothetical protein [Nocardia farcinica]|uniref:Uncharacterized protein n=1 Tax=Nocardia farcinica (strain IFM 10152) TaxID=247156 RepID=Q5YSJ5_NOCFA|nr:hypothetical protein [Nocardia farcinica]BAD58846.1 hypothetical protein NFA_39980 [Nocardia farcinica IFM 10152]